MPHEGGTQYSGPQVVGMGPTACNSIPGYRGPQAGRWGSLPGHGVHAAKQQGGAAAGMGVTTWVGHKPCSSLFVYMCMKAHMSQSGGWGNFEK